MTRIDDNDLLLQRAYRWAKDFFSVPAWYRNLGLELLEGYGMSAHLKVVNEQLDPHKRLDFVAVVPEQWSVESGFVTPTLKIKRNIVEKHYAGHFERWSKLRADVVWHDA